MRIGAESSSALAAGFLAGCDFSSSPTRRKPIVMALGRLAGGGRVVLDGLEALPSLDAFAAWLAEPRSWICAFDFPFGLPRELVEHLGWPRDWEARSGLRSNFWRTLMSRLWAGLLPPWSWPRA